MNDRKWQFNYFIYSIVYSVGGFMITKDKIVKKELLIKKYSENDIERFSTNVNNFVDGFNETLENFVQEFYDSSNKVSIKSSGNFKNQKLLIGRILAIEINGLIFF